MGVGYVLGCLLSILLWKLDRADILRRLNDSVRRFIKNRLLVQIIYLIIIAVILILFDKQEKTELMNFITAFLVIDVSNTERKNLNLGLKAHFYDSISIISRSLLCGFICPLFIILILGNSYAIAYMLICNLNFLENFRIIKLLFTSLSIVPSIMTQFSLYLIYMIRNRKFNIDFKGDYLINCITRPLLNIDIMGAYIESVNFYYYFNDKDLHYIKSYGEYTNRIDDMCVKDYLSLTYGICLVTFVIFYIILRLV